MGPRHVPLWFSAFSHEPFPAPVNRQVWVAAKTGPRVPFVARFSHLALPGGGRCGAIHSHEAGRGLCSSDRHASPRRHCTPVADFLVRSNRCCPVRPTWSCFRATGHHERATPRPPAPRCFSALSSLRGALRSFLSLDLQPALV